jgi:NAD(P)-dependent dehydrogenase (short-subunit alcohol dehydrogenase family)
MNKNELRDRIAVVTGASRGIGLAIASRLGQEGAKVVLVARNGTALREASKRTQGMAAAVAADVRSPQQVAGLFRRVQKRYAGLDILVNCAGIFTYKPFTETTFEDWQNNIATNLSSLFFITKAALPLLRRSELPRIVNVLSVSSRQAFPNCSAYTASKFGALGLTRVLRQELRAYGIRVTAVLPGLTDTGMIKEFGFKIPRAKLMQPEDVAEVVLAVLRQPARTSVEEIVVTPSAGAV